MEPIYEYLEINTKDIWPFEADSYLKSQRTDEQIYNLRNILEHLIVSKRSIQVDNNQLITIQPFVTIEDYDNGLAKEYWVRHINELSETKSQADRVRLGYFNILDRKGIDSFFSYEQDIEIDKTNDQFDFWFALKLSQYDKGLKHIPTFLEYQLKRNFEMDKKSFDDFLQIIEVQYTDEIISNRVMKIVRNWIIKKYEEQNRYGQYLGKNRTFCFNKLKEDSLFTEKSEVLIIVTDFLDALRRSSFIDSKLKGKEFIRFFEPKEFEQQERFEWLESNDLLKRFILQLANSGVIVTLKGKDKWLIARDCFVKKRNNEISNYDPEKLENSSGKESSKSELLEKEIKNFVAKIKKLL